MNKDRDPSHSLGEPKTAHPARCTICGRFICLTNLDYTSSFTPDSHFTYERFEIYHKTCDTGPRSTFRMDFLP